MNSILCSRLRAGDAKEILARIYAKDEESARERLAELVEGFEESFPGKRARIFSAPGRTEIGGNHTDHQRGQVVAASIDLDVIGAAAINNQNRINILSEGYKPESVEPGTEPREKKMSGGALALGIARGFEKRGVRIGGFDLYTRSRVPGGSGLSSSAAFAVLLGQTMNALFGGGLSDMEIAEIGRYAENEYCGKPSGLLDQAACACGGIVAIDFSQEKPEVTRINTDLESFGYKMCIVNTGDSHAALGGEYAAIPTEMRAVASVFGKEVLGQVDPALFYDSLPLVRRKAGDRALLRAMHFFAETERAKRQAQALDSGRFAEFLELVAQSGDSSYRLLQNIYPPCAVESQPIAVALAAGRRLLGKHGGVCRVHGGGFAGTVQAYVPIPYCDDFSALMEELFGAGCCHFIRVREVGAVEIEV